MISTYSTCALMMEWNSNSTQAQIPNFACGTFCTTKAVDKGALRQQSYSDALVLLCPLRHQSMITKQHKMQIAK